MAAIHRRLLRRGRARYSQLQPKTDRQVCAHSRHPAALAITSEPDARRQPSKGGSGGKPSLPQRAAGDRFAPLADLGFAPECDISAVAICSVIFASDIFR